MALRVYIDHMSQPARAVMIFVRANKLPAEEIVVSLRKQEQKGPEFTKINPFQKVPALVHDDFHLSESVAILRYLARAFPVPDHWYPKDLKAQALVDEYMSWQHIGLRVPVLNHFLAVLNPQALAPNLTSADMQNYKSKMEAALNDVESKWLGKTDFIVSNEISVADLLAVTEIEMTRTTVYNASQGRPNIAAYLKKVREAIGGEIYDEVHDVIFKYEERAKSIKARLNQP